MSGAAEPAGRVQRLARRPLEQMNGVVRGVLRALPRAVEDMFADRCTQYAAAIAYRVLFSLFPLTIALVSIFGLVLQDDELRQSVISELIDYLPVDPTGQADIQHSIEEIATPLSAIGLISLVALIWGASGMMASIRLGLEAAMKVDRGPTRRSREARGLHTRGGSGVLVLGIVGLSAFGAFFSKVADRVAAWAGVEAPSGSLLRDVIQLSRSRSRFCCSTASFRRDVSRRRGALAGAILTAVGIWGTTKVLGVIFGDFSRYNVIYGSLAGVMTFLFFVYVIAWILLLGAEFAYAWSQPAGPPGPPIRKQLWGAVRSLFVHHEEGAPRAPTEEPARRP